MSFWRRNKDDDPDVEYVEDEYYDDWDDEDDEEIDEHYEEGYEFEPPEWAEEYHKLHQEAYATGIYECPECGKCMVFENEWKDTLVCEHCGFSMSLDDYGVPDGCSYDDLFDTLPAPWGDDDDDDDPDERYDWDD